MKQKIAVFWFRRDLRLEDNVGLHYALKSGYPVLPVFIFDQDILSALTQKYDRRVDYIHQALNQINLELKKYQSTLHTYHGKPFEVFKSLNQTYDILSVYCNRDYEPKAIERDQTIYDYFKSINKDFKAYKDQVIFDKRDILKPDNQPYTVFTPYSKKWKASLKPEHYNVYPIDKTAFLKLEYQNIIALAQLGFEKTDIQYSVPQINVHLVKEYTQKRDYPAIQATTQLGTALRFGTISVRACVKIALSHSETWLNELIWREFFMQILYHFKSVVQYSFKEKYDRIQWRNNEKEFKLWCEGRTGYPMVDAGMRQLNTTGYMHNRVRMVVASFLCKHLLIDWRWGEAYFAQKLNDYDLSANNGNWQWAAGSGCDAAPYFRIFNPEMQRQKFDNDYKYIKAWIKEFGTNAYPKPIVNHEFARERALKVYQEAVKE